MTRAPARYILRRAQRTPPVPNEGRRLIAYTVIIAAFFGSMGVIDHFAHLAN